MEKDFFIIFEEIRGVSKDTSLIINITFSEYNVLGTIYIDIYQFHIYIVHMTFFCLLFIQTEKLQEHDLY